MSTTQAMSFQDAMKLAKRKAHYGHRTWIVWKDRDGNGYAERMSAASIKTALLMVGTACRDLWQVYDDGALAKFGFKGWITMFRTLTKMPHILN